MMTTENLSDIIELRNKTVTFTGHRPNKLGGYTIKSEINLKLKDALLKKVEELILEGYNRFISGGALGWDFMAFWVVHILQKKYPHIKNILAIPFEKQFIRWSDEQQMWFKKMLNVADEVVDVSLLPVYDSKEAPKLPYSDFSNKKMQKRNEYMVDHSAVVLACYDGTKGGTHNCVTYAREAMHTPLIYGLNPTKEYIFESLN